MSSPVTDFELHAYVDEQLSAQRRAEVEAYLGQNAGAAAQVADYRAQNAALHALFDPVLDEPLPARYTRPRHVARFSLMRVAAAVAWLAVGALLGLAAMEWRDHRSYEAAVMRPAMLAYRTYIEDKNHAVEVGADQEAAMRNWLSKRMDVQIAIPKFDAQGYSLLGGRLLPGGERPNCQLVYQRADGRRVALFMTRERGADGRALSVEQRGATALAHWSNGTLTFVVAGDASRDEVRAFAEAAQAQLGAHS